MSLPPSCAGVLAGSLLTFMLQRNLGFLHQQAPSAQNQGRGTGTDTNEPLQGTELDPFHPLPEASDLLFDSCLGLFDLQLLSLGLLPNPALF